jgi:hypothetical protein
MRTHTSYAISAKKESPLKAAYNLARGVGYAPFVGSIKQESNQRKNDFTSPKDTRITDR